jgi:hypothetical protein
MQRVVIKARIVKLKASSRAADEGAKLFFLPQRLAASGTVMAAENDMAETDCVAGHIGFEVRRETGRE